MRFSRPWRHLERVFPPAGALTFPDQLAPAVFPTYDALARYFTAGGRLGFASDTSALNAGTNTITLSNPNPGMIQLPIAVTVFNPDAAARFVRLDMITSGSAEAFGRWESTAGVIDEVSIAAGVHARLAAIAVPRGNALRVRMLGMTGGNNASIGFWFLEVPGELALTDNLRGAS